MVNVVNISHLVLKDVMLIGRFFALLWAGEVFLLLTLALQLSDLHSQLGTVSSIVAFVGGFLICLRSTAIEEKNRAFQFIKLLPVSTLELVVAKFAANIALVTTNFALLFTGVALGTIFWDVQLDVGVAGFAGSLAGQIIVNAVFVSTAMAFGSEKAIWAPFALLFVLFNVMMNVDTLGLTPAADFVPELGPIFVVAMTLVAAMLFVALMVCATTVAMTLRRTFG